MKTLHLVLSALILAGSPLALLACGGDGGGGGGQPAPGTVGNPDVLKNIGGIAYEDNGAGTTYNLYSNGLYSVTYDEFTTSEGNGVYLDTGDERYVELAQSNAATTRDTNLERANLQQADLQARAQRVADRFQMDFDRALELTQLADRMKALSSSGQVTAADRQAVTRDALGIAGVTSAEVNQAIGTSLQGDDRATDELLAKAAAHLGMPSASALRDQLLPALGIQL